MSKKQKIFNILYWINIVSLIVIKIFRYWSHNYVKLCGNPCDKCVQKLTTGTRICSSRKLYLFYEQNYNIITNLFAVWLLIALMISIVLLIVLIKKKEWSKILIEIILVLILLFL